jgi:DNA polymerase-3 subunit gamma/tau
MVQLAYQICVQGRADLPLAPDEATGFSMTLLRLLAFEPGGGPKAGEVKDAPRRNPVKRDAVAGAAAPIDATAASRASAPVRDTTTGATPVNAPTLAPATVPPSSPVPAPTPDGSEPPARVPMPMDPAAWPAFVTVLRLAPMAAQLAAQTELKSIAGNVLTLALPAAHKHLADKGYADKLKAALEQASGRKLMLAFEVGEAAPASLAAQEKRERDEARERSEAAFRAEPFVRDLVEQFDARIRPDSIKPL